MKLTQDTAPRRVRRAQTLSLALLVLSGIVNYMDRGTLSVANQTIRAELGVSLGQMGLLLSAFSWSYALAQLPVGGLVDRVGPRKLLGLGLVVWSLAQAAGGLVSSFGQFIASRVVLGVGEAPQFPAAARVVSNWFPLRARGTPTGIFNSASPLGTALAPLLLTLLMVYLDWRWMFLLMGLAGLVVAVIWLALYRDPSASRLTAAEMAYLAEDDAAPADAAERLTFADWGRLFRHTTTWGMILGFFGSVYLNWVYLTWLPGYLTLERHMSLVRTGFAASVPFLCGFIGCLVAGWFSDRLTRGSDAPVGSRKKPVVLAMIGMAVFTVPAALVEDNTVALACISVVIFLANAASACSWTLVTAVAPPNRVASLGSLQNFGGFLGGALAPILTGYIAEATSFVPALLTGAAIAFLGAMSYLFLVREPIPQEHAAPMLRLGAAAE
ncbi:MAG TPA: MFS transporter [Stellaceae bacterium]|nr:MFS transporter [Stellaceae bacterium]